jgi:bile acid:Na+ symporter, BASS family
MAQNPLIEIGLPIVLAIIMVGIGLTLTTGHFRRELRTPRGTVIGSIAQLVAMPALGFGMAWALRLPPLLAVGLVLCAACPGGVVSNLLAYLARANVALSIILTVVASLLTIVTLPIAVNLAIAWQPTKLDAEIVMPLGRTVALLVGVVLLPVGIGMAVRARSAALAQRLERGIAVFGGVVLALLVIGIIISLRDRFWELAALGGPAAALLNLGGLGLGVGVGALAGLGTADRLTCAIELGLKNTTLGMVIALTIVGSEVVAVPAAVYGLVMFASAGAVIAFSRRRLAPDVVHRSADAIG